MSEWDMRDLKERQAPARPSAPVPVESDRPYSRSAPSTFEVDMKRVRTALAVVAVLAVVASIPASFHAIAEVAKKEKDGKWETADGNPTYNIVADGTVDWYTFSGFRRYHSDCHTCHGPDGEGSTYAPGLLNSMKTMSYPEFMVIVAAGRQVVRTDKESVMPAFGNNPNVRCYVEDIYVYLKARADGVLPRGRPAKRMDKPAAAEAHEKACMG